MKAKWLISLLLTVLTGLSAEAELSKSLNSGEYIFRAGKIESAAACPAPESQTRKPKFHPIATQPDLLKDLTHGTLQISQNGPQELAGTYLQLDYDRLPQVNNRNVYVYYTCDGTKYFGFKVFKAGSLAPIAIIGVSEKETSLFDGARRISDALALAEIDPDHYSATTSELRQNRLDPARVNASPVAAQTQAALGKLAAVEISDADIQAAEEGLKLSDPGSQVVFKPVRKTEAPAPVQQVAAKPNIPRGATTASAPVARTTVVPSSPAPVLGNIEMYHQIAPWSKVSGSMLWTRQAVESIRIKMAALNEARDINDFCPGYTKASTTESQHIACWIRIVGGVMQKESSFITHDSLTENSGEESVGLMAMSPGQCPNASSIKALKDPIKNIECAINVMARLIARDHYISVQVKTKRGSRWAGAAGNWSCLRTPYTVYVRAARKKVRVGFKQDIIRVASSYDRII